ncbi:hypothetical protein BGZ70_008078 [Mortierella alpina]|uniref:BZIP domain-containing protein n=1 Tax=Mortierella alpina TaxID=64518 RepID=A0A9P6M257_MORAP|nr:hypothetical protein BGZ70_008078 [Mortierella alpina]
MLGSGGSSDQGPGPGPAPPPSLTLPPLRELDKSIRPETHSMASAPSPGLGLGLMGTGPSRPAQQIPSDPYFHQHLSSQQPSQQPLQYQHPLPHQQAIHHAYPLASPHGPGPHQYYGHDHHSRHSSSVGSLPDLHMSSSSAPSTTTTSSLSRADSLSTMEYLQGGSQGSYYGRGGGSATTGSSAGSSFGRSVTSRSGSTGSIGRSLQHHHSMGSIGRANLNAAVHQQRRLPQENGPSPTPPKAAASKAAGDNTSAGNGKTGSSSGTEQGRNSTKRAAQNRAAQRAFRQRKDLYVRDLERKADMLQRAEGTIMKLEARNRELECTLLIVKQSHPQALASLPLPPSSQHSPLPHHSNVSPTAGAAATIPPMAADRDRQDRDSMDRERAQDQRFPARRLALGRHASSHQLHHAYNSDSSSPTLTNGSLKQLSLSNRRHLQRPESDYEADNHERHAPHRPLHRHPSEPSLGLGRRQGSLSADSDDYFGAAGKIPLRSRYADPGDTVAARSGSIDSSGMESSHHSTSPSQFSPLAHPDHAAQQDRPPLHPVSAQGARPAGASAAASGGFPVAPVTKPWNSASYPQDDDMKPSPSLAPTGGMVATASPVGRPHAGAEMEYMSDDHRSETGPGYETPIKKRPSDGSIREWTDSRRGGPHPLTPRSPVGLPPLSALDMEMQDSHHHTQQQRHQPPQPQYSQHRHLNHRGSASSLSGRDGGERRPSGSETSGGGHSRVMTTESPDLSSLSSESRFNSSTNTASASTPGQVAARHQQLYFSSLQQQHQQLAQQALQQQQRAGLHSLHRQSPENEHLPGGMVGYGASPRVQISHQQHRPGHQSEYSDSEDKYSRNQCLDPAGPEMDTFYDQQQQQPVRASVGYHNEASMRSP